MIFTSAMSLKGLENLDPVWKSFEIEFLSVFCLNNFEVISFVKCLYTKYLLVHRSKRDFAIIGWVYLNVNYFPEISWKEKENKINWKNLESRCFISTVVKHHIYIYIYIYIYVFTNPSARAGYDTRSIFKRSLTGLTSEFPSPRLVASARLKIQVCPTIYP